MSVNLKHYYFSNHISQECQGVPAIILNPRNTWSSGEEYDKKVLELKEKIRLNFEKYNKYFEVVS